MKDITTFIIEEINRWSTASKFETAITMAIHDMSSNDASFIAELLKGDFDDIDDLYKKNKKTIVAFLSNMYPTESFARKSDVAIIDRMHELQETYKRFSK